VIWQLEQFRSPSVMAMTSTGLRSCWERAGPTTRGCSTLRSRLVPRGVVPVNLICNTSDTFHMVTLPFLSRISRTTPLKTSKGFRRTIRNKQKVHFSFIASDISRLI